MDRVVKQLYGKLYMGTQLVPHYYVQFKDKAEFEYVPCSEVNISTAQKVAFDANFEKDERRAGYAVRNKGTKKLNASKPLAVRNYFVADSSIEDAMDNQVAMQQNKTGAASQSTTTVVEQGEQDDEYESSFINDSTPTFHSSSDSEPTTSRAMIKPVLKRKRAFLERDDEMSSDSSPRKPTHSSSRKLTSRAAKLDTGVSKTRKGSTAPSKYTPLIILGASNDAYAKSSTASSPDIPVITLD
ncbi:hypothetical protein AAVH_11923 [Aphelenchoides avenae]|nr:hypothetical protein AAVH_11923 [Aphelenchus avenae]